MTRDVTLCKKCPVCNGIACRGQIPGVGGIGRGLSFIRNVEALQKYALKMDVLNELKEISTETTYFGETFSLPILCAPIAGIKNNYGTEITDVEYNRDLAIACKEEKVVCFVGDGIDMENNFKLPAYTLHENDCKGFVTIKPWQMNKVEERIKLAQEFGIFGIAMDIDAAGLPLLRNASTPVENKSMNDLKKIKMKCKDKPFIVKGIMTKEAALLACEASADGIIVSNHGGRVLDETEATIDVLEEIVDAVKGKVVIFVDGGFRTGNDVFKALALGADGVLIGRPIALACAMDGSDGVKQVINKFKNELNHAMRMTGCSTLADINKSKIKKQTM